MAETSFETSLHLHTLLNWQILFNLLPRVFFFQFKNRLSKLYLPLWRARTLTLLLKIVICTPVVAIKTIKFRTGHVDLLEHDLQQPVKISF